LEAGAILRPGKQGYCSPFHAHLVEGCLVLTDALSFEPQAHGYLDPLWEAPRLAPLLVRGRVATALDMGCGSGVLSLVMASYAREVVGVDVNPRAIVMSRLNAALNGVHNVAFLEGDLFDPIASASFDRVVFNSPTHKEGNRYIDLLRTGEGI